MSNILPFVFSLVIVGHGLIHLLGFVAYYPLRAVPELAYKTTFLDGRLELGHTGTRLYSIVWLLVAVAFVVVGVGWFANSTWVRPFLIGVTLVSLVITIMDYRPAMSGIVIDLLILTVVFLSPFALQMFTR
jgi:hypothetical protein